ncbi:MAG: FAD-dependent oxidoreductase [Actinomycetota bacterium]|nr:FAD-dependent oxidoreductase [Actinomycetota bacterium]
MAERVDVVVVGGGLAGLSCARVVSEARLTCGPGRAAARVGDPALFVAGDHRDTASIQGALYSGRRAGSAVLRDLGVTGSSG